MTHGSHLYYALMLQNHDSFHRMRDPIQVRNHMLATCDGDETPDKLLSNTTILLDILLAAIKTS